MIVGGIPMLLGGGAAASKYIAVAHTAAPVVTAYPWSSAGFGTKFADPATLPGGAAQNSDFGL